MFDRSDSVARKPAGDHHSSGSLDCLTRASLCDAARPPVARQRHRADTGSTCKNPPQWTHRVAVAGGLRTEIHQASGW